MIKRLLYFILPALLGVAAVLVWRVSDSEPPDLNGPSLFKKKCGTCHSIKDGVHKVGPSLHGVIGRKAGSSDFASYRALKEADMVWDERNLDKWIADPKKFIGKPTAMTVKVKKENERQAIIEFLKAH